MSGKVTVTGDYVFIFVFINITGEFSGITLFDYSYFCSFKDCKFILFYYVNKQTGYQTESHMQTTLTCDIACQLVFFFFCFACLFLFT